MTAFDPYAELGVSRDATLEQITKAFRKKARKAHPDTGGSDEAFARLRKAHDILKDAARRAKYDATGDASEMTPARNPDDEALGWISRMIGVALGGSDDPSSYALEKAAISALQKHLADHTNDLAKLHRINERAKKLRGRFKRKVDGENVIDGIVAWHESQSAAMIKGTKAAMEHIRRAIEIVEQYGFDMDSPLQQLVYRQAGGTSQASGGGFFFFGGSGGI